MSSSLILGGGWAGTGEGEETDGMVGRRLSGEDEAGRLEWWEGKGMAKGAEMKGEATFAGVLCVCHLLPLSSFLPLSDSFLVSPLLVYSPLPAVFFPDHPLSLKTPCSASCCVFPARHFHSSEIQLNILAAL